MARDLYAGTLVLTGTGGVGVSLAPGLAFTVWNDLIAGSNVTGLLTQPDGSGYYPPLTDTNGNIPSFRGPDGFEGDLFISTGLPGPRYLVESPTLKDKLVAFKNATPTGGTGGGTALTSYVNQVASLLDYPAAFPPSSHTHTSGQITDATTTGKTLLTSTSADSALSGIGGVKNSGGVSSLRAVTSTTAALSNGVPTLAVVSGQVLFVYAG